MGQYEDLANPCDLMTMMGAIAGRGSAREPYLLDKVCLLYTSRPIQTRSRFGFGTEYLNLARYYNSPDRSTKSTSSHFNVL